MSDQQQSQPPTLVVVGGYAEVGQPGIHLFQLDPAGGLRACGSYAGVQNPSFVILHPNRRWLYAVSERGQDASGAAGAVCALRLTIAPPTIAPLNQQPSGGEYPCHLQLDRSGRWLLVSNYGSGVISVLPLRDDGSLGASVSHVQHHGHGVDPERQDGPHTHSAIFTPDNHFAIIADLGLDQLAVYAFDATTGQLSQHAQVQTRPGAGPRHFAFHPGGRLLYVANELDSTVACYSYDAAGGALHERQTLPTVPSEAPKNLAADIHLDAAGRRLFVSNRGHNSIAVFDVTADGQLTPRATQSCGGDWPRNFALAPDERFLLVANQYSGDLVALPLLDDDATIGPATARVTVDQASCVQVLAEQ